MTKRLSALILALLMIFSLAACGEKDREDTHDDEPDSSQEEGMTAEEAFAKAFQADKDYDVKAMSEVEYAVNFKKDADKEERVKKAEDTLKGIDEETLKAYREELADLSYTILDETPLEGDELKNRIAQLEQDYKDTDKITEIIKVTYMVNEPGSDDENYSDNAVEMIRVDGTWYCYLGDDRW